MTKFQQQVKAFWESGDEALLDDLREKATADRLAEHGKKLTAARARLDDLNEQVKVAADALRTGPITEVEAQRVRIDALQSDWMNHDAVLRNLRASPPSEQVQGARHVLGTWGTESSLLSAPWSAHPGAALALCELRGQLDGLDPQAIASDAGVALSDDCELIVEEVLFPKIVVKGTPTPGWRDSDPTILYRLGEEDAFLLTRLLLRCPRPKSDSGRPEFVSIILAYRQNVQRGDPSLIDLHDFTVPEPSDILPLVPESAT